MVSALLSFAIEALGAVFATWWFGYPLVGVIASIGGQVAEIATLIIVSNELNSLGHEELAVVLAIALCILGAGLAGWSVGHPWLGLLAGIAGKLCTTVVLFTPIHRWLRIGSD